MRLSLAIPVLVLLLAPATLSLAPPAEAIACASPAPGPGLVGATVYFVAKTVSDNCNNTLWYSCYVITTLLGPGNCPA